MATAEYRRWERTDNGGGGGGGGAGAGRDIFSPSARFAQSVSPFAARSPPPLPPNKPQLLHHHHPNQPNNRPPCNCCPYGYHIDVDFVQYAEDARRTDDKNRSLKKTKRGSSLGFSAPGSASSSLVRHASQQRHQSPEPFGVLSAAAASSKSASATFGGTGSSTSSPLTSPRLANQAALFSDSLENVVSDFEETLSQHGGVSGRSKQYGGYASDYEQNGKKREAGLEAFMRSPALRAGAGRPDGYASDCGYAVPTPNANQAQRPNTLKFNKREMVHYAASPSLPTPPPVNSHNHNHNHNHNRNNNPNNHNNNNNNNHNHNASSIAGGYAAPGEVKRLASAFSDSMSSLSSASSLQNGNGVVGGHRHHHNQQQQQQQHHHDRVKSPASSSSHSPRYVASPGHQQQPPPPPPPPLKQTNGGRAAADLVALLSPATSRRVAAERLQALADEQILDSAYSTAMARAMTSNVNATSTPTPTPPPPPPRSQSVGRVSPFCSSSPTPSPILSQRVRHNSGTNASLNLDSFHSFRRSNNNTPAGGSNNNNNNNNGNNGNNADSDSEFGHVGLERFSSLRRSRNLLSRPTAQLEDTSRSQSTDRDSVSTVRSLRQTPVDSQLSGRVHGSASPRIVVSGSPDTLRKPIIGASVRPMTQSNATQKDTDNQKLVIKIDDETAASNTTTSVRTMRRESNETPLNYVIEVPQQRPCTDCIELRQRILNMSEKPLVYSRSSNTDGCMCAACERQHRLKVCSFGVNTDVDLTAAYRRDAGTTVRMTCEECFRRDSVIRMSFGVNTNDVEVRNRQTNTDATQSASTAVNTDATGLRTTDAQTAVDKTVLHSCGGYRNITSNTTPPMMVSFGVNTDAVSPLTSDATSDGQTIVVQPVPVMTRAETRDVEASTMDAPWLQEQDVAAAAAAAATSSIDAKKLGDVSRRSVSVGTKPMTMLDKSIDSTVRTRTVGTRTPPPPPPPLLAVTCTSTQTVNRAPTLVSVGCETDRIETCQANIIEAKPESINNETKSDQKPRRIERILSPPLSVEYSTSITADEKTPTPTEPIDTVSATVVVRRSPLGQTCSSVRDESTDVMWTSQTSNADRLEISEEAICPLDDEDENGAEEPEEDEQPDDDANEHDEEEEPDQQESIDRNNQQQESNGDQTKAQKRFDFTRPRQTRAFALSKAAATKKLLTSDSKVDRSEKHTFQRGSLQSKSVRIDTRKGDSLAYITEKRQRPQTDAGSATVVSTVQSPNTGLKGKVAIKKAMPTRKMTPVPLRTVPSSRPTTSLNGGSRSRMSAKPESSSRQRHPGQKDEEAVDAEADDVVGPLPSEVVKAELAMERTRAACYVNPSAVNGQDADGQPSADGRLVGRVVENLPDTETDDCTDSDVSSDESPDEGSYDTNGNISSKCELSEAGKQSEAVKPCFGPRLRQACQMLSDHLENVGKAPVSQADADWAQRFLQHEWLKSAASKRADASHAEEFLDMLESYSRALLHKTVNFWDQNENTALHYAVSHGNFDIVSLLLDTKVCNLNLPNKAGYTPLMLAALCNISSDTDRIVIQRLFQMGDVNIKASQHGQTSLMLAVSHGKLETTRLLLEAGAGVNIQDEDGSTALMCAAEHGHKEIVHTLLLHPDIDAGMTDYEGSTALSIAMENGHEDIGVLIYAHLNYRDQRTH